MAEMKDQKLAAAEAEERMKLIAPLLAPGLSREALAEMKKKICEDYRISDRTLRRYLQLYRESGFEGLKPQGHETGEKYKIPQEVLEEAIRLRREQPNRSIPTIIQILELEGVVPEGFLKRSTLQDAFTRAGYSSAMMKLYQNDGYASQRFQRKHRHDLWQGDIKYGPILKIDGKPVQTYFSCLIDDCTRYILHGEFYDTMNQSIVEDTLHRAIQKYGIPRRLYFDNGSQYRTHWMTRACGLFGIRLLYARPRNPQGKGKQERFNLTVEAFLDEINLKQPSSLEELNRKFQVWLSECYHTREHSALGTTPEIAFKSDSMPCRFPETAVMARAFLHCEQRKADKSGCISFQGQKYDLGIRYAGRQVDMVYDPMYTDILTIETKGEHPFQVQKLQIGEHVAPRPQKIEPPTIPTDHSRLLDAAEKKFDERRREQQFGISYSALLEKKEDTGHV